MSFEVPAELRYLESHEWAAVEDGSARIGITEFAQDELGDVVFVELPAVGTHLSPGERFGTVESIKAVSDVYSPVAGEVTAVNEALQDRPELVNEDPYGEGWMVEVDLEAGSDVESETLSAEQYRERIE